MSDDYIYAVLPECGRRRCTITRTDDLDRMQSVYQHGDNPEAVLIVDRISSALDPAAEVRRRMREFTDRCHRYDDDHQPDAPD